MNPEHQLFRAGGSARLLAAVLLALTCGAAGAAAEEALPREVTIRQVEFVLVPEGEFYRHQGLEPEVAPESQMIRSRLGAFYIAKYEARARDLAPFMNEVKPDSHLYAGDFESCSMRREKNGQYFLVSPAEDLPATHMSWALADRWARWMGFRLPTESEWEKAARGNDQRMYPWGDAAPDDTYANFLTTSSCMVWPVDRAAKGRSPYGVFNMAGNIREYVADWHDGEKDAGRQSFLSRFKVVDENGKPRQWGEPKLLKGGRWASSPLQLQISHRLAWASDDEAFQCNGTRFAVDASVVREHLAKGSAVITRQ